MEKISNDSGRQPDGIALTTMLLPLLTLLIAAPLRTLRQVPHARSAFAGVLAGVWKPGVGLALSGVGFGAITTFIALLFAEHGWQPVWVAFSALKPGVHHRALVLRPSSRPTRRCTRRAVVRAAGGGQTGA